MASAAATRIEAPFFEQLDDMNPCSGLPNTVTISGMVRVIDQDGREAMHSEREISTSAGFAGRGASTDVINDRNEMFRLPDMVTNESGARFRAQFRIVADPTTEEVRTIREAPTLTCLRS